MKYKKCNQFLKRTATVALAATMMFPSVAATPFAPAAVMASSASDNLEQEAKNDMGITNNLNDNDYGYTAKPHNPGSYKFYDSYCTTTMRSFFVKKDDGFMRVEYLNHTDDYNSNNPDGTILIEYYDSNFKLLRTEKMKKELPVWGGFFEGKDCYYIVTGQNNPEKDRTKETVRVTKYDKDWNRLGSASINNNNTRKPFDGGTVRMSEGDGYLYMYMSRELYDGHQASDSYQIKIDTMTLTKRNWINASHSFNQFIKADDKGHVITIDHGDASPRASYMGVFNTADLEGHSKFLKHIMKFTGESGQNYTGASIGGLEYSTNNYLTAGNIVKQDDDWMHNNVRKLYVSVTDRESGDTQIKWIGNYPEDSEVSPGTPQLIKLGDDSFLLLWAQASTEEIATGGDDIYNGKINYVFLDGEGNTTSEIYEGKGALSDCQPMVDNDGSVLWYVTDGKTMSIYSVDQDGKLTKNVPQRAEKEPTVTFAKSGGRQDLADKTYVNELTTDSDGEEITYKSSDESVATVDKDGKVTFKGAGKVTITAEVSHGLYYKAGSASYDLDIVELKQQHVATKADKFKCKEGDVIALDASAEDNAGLTYESSNEKVATVDEDGNITAVGGGKATITIKAAQTESYGAAKKQVTVQVLKIRQFNQRQLKDHAYTYGYDYYAGKNKFPLIVSLQDKDGEYLGDGDYIDIDYRSNDENIVSIDKDGMMTFKSAGTATITVSVPETEEYTAAEGTVRVTVRGVSLDRDDWSDFDSFKNSLSYTTYRYNGKAKRPIVTIMADGKKLRYGKDYTVEYKNNVNVGTGTAVIRGKGGYTGTFTRTYRIVPKGSYVTSSVSKKKRTAIVRWKKNTEQTTGYQIRYGRSKSLSNGTTRTITNNKTTSKTLYGLRRKSTYYVKVRTYKVVDGTRYYSDWSKVKTVRVK